MLWKTLEPGFVYTCYNSTDYIGLDPNSFHGHLIQEPIYHYAHEDDAPEVSICLGLNSM